MPLPVRELLLRLDDLDRRVLELRLGFADGERPGRYAANRPGAADLGHPGPPHRGAGAGDVARIVPSAGFGSAVTLWALAEHNGRVGSDDGRGSAWWSRSRGLPRTVYDSWKILAAWRKPDRPARILGWARTPAGFCIASPATFSYGDEQGWKHLGWHEIERGGWNAELSKLELGAARRARRGVDPRLARADSSLGGCRSFSGSAFRQPSPSSGSSRWRESAA